MMDVAKITGSVDHYDDIAEWQQKLRDKTDETSFYEISAGLIKVYGQLAKQGKFLAASKIDKRIAGWLNEQLQDFWKIVMSKLTDYPTVASSVALKIILIRGKYSKQPIEDLFKELFAESLKKETVFQSIQSQITDHDDLRFLAISNITEVPPETDTETIVSFLCSIDKEITTDADLQSIYASKDVLPFADRTAALKYKQGWQKAWLHVLKQDLTKDEVKQILTVMHTRIIPNFVKPQLLMDFLVDAYEHGGAISLLALNALFVLIQHHQLDYPQFFTKLYELLEDGSILASAHRARFLRLLDLFLTSTHLPATITASIIKRLARMCLFAPPGAIVAILPFVYNQLKRHSTCMVMIHRPNVTMENDPFNNDEADPLNTKALDSSLWELQSLTTHYHPNVAAIAKIFSQPFRKPQYLLEHFLHHSYETLYTTEYHRKRDREPSLEFDQYNLLEDLV